LKTSTRTSEEEQIMYIVTGSDSEREDVVVVVDSHGLRIEQALVIARQQMGSKVEIYNVDKQSIYKIPTI
jgi:hypothetical protein